MTSESKALLARMIVVATVILSIHSACHLQYDCGCEPIWASGVDHCNVYVPGTPNCPWCAGGTPRFALISAFIFAGVYGGFWFARRRALGPAGVIAVALAAYVAVALIVGIVSAIIWDYPTWFGFRL